MTSDGSCSEPRQVSPLVLPSVQSGWTCPLPGNGDYKDRPCPSRPWDSPQALDCDALITSWLLLPRPHFSTPGAGSGPGHTGAHARPLPLWSSCSTKRTRTDTLTHTHIHIHKQNSVTHTRRQTHTYTYTLKPHTGTLHQSVRALIELMAKC